MLIQLASGPPDVVKANLQRLLNAATKPDGNVSTDPPLRLAMHGDEQHHLRRLIDRMENASFAPSGPDDVALQFFVYMHEGDIYKDGRFINRENVFKIRLAGPPIPGSFAQKEMEAVDQSDPLPPVPANAQTVAIGIIDDGLAFAHERFRAGENRKGRKTRFRALWLQETETIADDDRYVLFGRVLDPNAIDEKIENAGVLGHDVDVYRAAETYDFSGRRQTPALLRLAHGTHVMDLACGFDPNSADEQEREHALRFPIFAVQLPDAVTADTSGVNMGSYVLQGLRQIMLWADNVAGTENAPPDGLPLVVNFSYGITAGPKDGTHPLEVEISRLVKHRRAPTKVVIPAGNSYQDRTTAKMRLSAQGDGKQIDWVLLPDDGTPSYVEIWFDLPADAQESPIRVTVTPPVGPAGPGERPQKHRAAALSASDKPYFAVYFDTFFREHDEQWRGRIVLAVNATKSWDADRPVAPSGAWTIALHNGAAHEFDVDLYIQRDDTPAGFRRKGRQSNFHHSAAYERDPKTGNYDAFGIAGPICHEATLSAIGTGDDVILVGAADFVGRREAAELEPAAYTSSGPTKGKERPDISAITEEGPAFSGMLSAGSLSGSVVAMRGTSVAAPQVTRQLALNGLDLGKVGATALEHRDPSLQERIRRLGDYVLHPPKSRVPPRQFREALPEPLLPKEEKP